MSGGRLVVLDRLGRDVKQYPLPSGLATLGRDPNCDIRVMLSTVSPHHATVVVHANQTVVRNVSDSETLVNGRCVSVAALRHKDIITIGDRSLRWEYSEPDVKRPMAPQPALYVRTRKSRTPKRSSAVAGGTQRAPDLQLALEMHHRASMPGNAGGKQVAIVQPQRRDMSEQNVVNTRTVSSPRSAQNKRARLSKNETPDSPVPVAHDDKSTRKSTPRVSPKTLAMQNTTKATLWIESRKTSPRKSIKVQTPRPVVATRKAAVSAKKSTPLRMAVLRKAQSAQKMRVTKIEAPLKIDHTKQAAIMLMTGHTPKSNGPNSKQHASRTPTLVVKKTSPIRKTPRGRKSSAKKSKEPTPNIDSTPKRASVYSNTTRRSSKRGSALESVSVLEVTNSDTQNSTIRASTTSRRSKSSTMGSPLLPSPKKSALKDPTVKKSMRKTESIKFDLSNLENYSEDQSDVLTVTDTTQNRSYEGDTGSEDNLTLHYSDTSTSKSPSPRKSIHSRSSRMLETLGTSLPDSRISDRGVLVPQTPQVRKSLRGSLLVQKALDTSADITLNSRRSTRTLTDQSWDTTAASAFKTRTLSPRASNQNMESYSIVDLVSMDSNESENSASVYDSVGSTRSSSIVFGTPQNNTGRKTRSTIDKNFIGSSTPYVEAETKKSLRSNSSPNISTRKSSPNKAVRKSTESKRSKSLSTPENSQKHISVNSTKISRASRSRSRINDSELQYISDESGVSPKSSKKLSRTDQSQDSVIGRKSSSSNKRVSARRSLTINTTQVNSPQNEEGIVTPENRESPKEVGTPVLSIQSLLDSSQSSVVSQKSPRTRASANVKRKTIGHLSAGRKVSNSPKSKSLNMSGRRSLRSFRTSKESSADSDKTDENAPKPDNDENVTPKSAVKLVHEAVKNKHSTAKKPQSKRSIIDNLNESDIVKQLFNSPVKRKLSQSMTEFSRKQLFNDDDMPRKRPTRNTVALTGRTPDNSILNHSEQFTPENFVSPLGTPSNSPNISGIKRLFKKNTPENDLRNVSGVRSLLRTPRTRRSVKNDLTNVAGVKAVFAKSPKNRLSDVRVKEIFAHGLKNDLKRISGVKSLFQSQNVPKNDLSNVTGVRSLFKRKSAVNDLRNVSGVKRTLQNRSPRNDLTDVRGVRRMFRQEKQLEDSDLSGIEELFDVSINSRTDKNVTTDPEKLFDQLLGKPPIKAVYSKSFVKSTRKQNKSRKAKSFHVPINVNPDNVEEWIQQELNKLVHKDNTESNKASRELQKLVTDTVEGSVPVRKSRIRNSTLTKSQLEETGRKKSASELYSTHTLPIKKRSLVETSMEKSLEPKLHILPIKKRVVVHSTPVKGKYNLTMNASELGRVSPIAVVDKTRNLETDTTSRSVSQKAKVSPKLRGSASKVKEIVHYNEPQKSPEPKRKRGVQDKINDVIHESTTVILQSPRKGRRETDRKSAGKRSPKELPKATTIKTTSITENKKVQIQPSRTRRTRNNTEKQDIAKQSPQKEKSVNKSNKKATEKPVELPRTRRTRNNLDKQENIKESSKHIGKKGIKSKNVVEEEKTAETKLKTSPNKKTRATDAKVLSPVVATTTRSRRNKTINIEVTNTKKRRSSLVITKKLPVMTPKPTRTKNTRGKAEKTVIDTKMTANVTESPKKAISTRRQKAELREDKSKTPKSTRARVAKSSVVVVKPSPKLKPQAAKTKSKDSTDVKSTRSTRANEDMQGKSNKGSPKKLQTELNKRSRRTVEKPQEPEPQTKRSRSTRVTNVTQKSVQDTKAKGKKAEKQQSVQSEPTTRTRRTNLVNNTVMPDTQKSRKRKTVEDQEVVPAKVVKTDKKATRGKKVVEASENETLKGRQKRSTGQDNKAEVNRGNRQVGGDVVDNKSLRVSRSTKVQKTVATKKSGKKEEEAKPVRGEKVVDVQEDKRTGNRKRKTNATSSPVKEPAKKTRSAAAVSVSPAKGRSTRAKNNAEVVTAAATRRTASRSRRR